MRQKQSNISMPLSKGNITLEIVEWLDAWITNWLFSQEGAGRRKEGEYVIERVTDVGKVYGYVRVSIGQLEGYSVDEQAER